MEQHKTCHICKKLKSIDNFYKSSLQKSDFICKKCSVSVGRENRKKRFKNNEIHERYLYAKNSAKTTGKPFLLTENEYKDILSKNCFYCKKSISELGIGLDRINNDKSIGYTLNNVLPCCGFCNRIRGHLLTVEEAQVAIFAVMEFRKIKQSSYL